MNDRSMKFFMMICRKTAKELKSFLDVWVRRFYPDENVINEDGFLYVKGTDEILLTAHMDTVHFRQCKIIDVKEEKGCKILSSKDGIGGDDRCGIFMILRIIETTKLRPSILFCEDEEIGGVGSRKFVATKYVNDLKKMLFLIELDRAHKDDLVYYQDGNEEFHKFCENTTGYFRSRGTFSDICNMSPACGVSSVNISCGYYNAHRLTEYVNYEEMENSIEVTKKLIMEGLEKGIKYEYKRNYLYGYDYYSNSNYRYDYSNSNYRHDYSYGDDYYYGYKKKETKYCYTFHTDRGSYYYGFGVNLKEALGDMMINNPHVTYGSITNYDSRPLSKAM